MGFYGQIVNSNKAAFTFDHIYANRYEMEQKCETDGVFLGRYVLIEYDGQAIQVYFNQNNHQIYLDARYTNALTPIEDALYQDVLTGVFYVYKNETQVKAAQISLEKEPYTYNYSVDVKTYGRGYDSTAWIKRYDVETNKYKYTMIAELNTVVPDLHVLVDPPSEETHVPYFDKDSTNLAYYLHLSGNYHDTVKQATSTDVSDEQVTRLKNTWNYNTATGAESYTSSDEVINADIFYNKAGFDSDTRTYVDDVADAINFTKTASGRRYSSGVFEPTGLTGQKDTREWYIRLPSVGNAICQMWDKMYGESRNKTLAISRGDEKALYDKATTIGIINQVRDLLGYTFAPLGSKTVGSRVTAEDINLYYTADDSGVPQIYYYYAYSPTFAKSTSGDYYLENGEYKLANKAVIATSDLYARTDSWILTALDMPEEDSLYGLIFSLHKIIGTGDADSRDLDTLTGCINRIKDIIDNIDTQLVPNRLLWTTSDGAIQTSDTQFPSADADSARVLTGAGDWENRIRKMGVVTPSTSESTWTTSTGTIDTHTNNNNTVNLKAGNKWIGLSIDTDNDQLIQILHSASAQEAHDFATDVVIDNDIDGTKGTDCEFTIPLVKTDNAGHVIGYSTKTIYVPYGYHNIILAAQSDSESKITASNGTQSADATNDSFTFATGNQWIEARVDEDKITFAHALIDGDATQKWQFTPTATDGWKASGDGNKLTIPTFEIDNAGHIVRNSSVDFYIPHNFRNITVVANGADVDATQTAGTIEADSTTDTWTIASQNQWLKVAADATNDKITIGHTYSAQAAHDFDSDVSIVSALDGTSQTDNKIILPVLKTDNAGHIIGYSTNTFYIPHNFKSITVTTDSDADVDSTQTNGTIIADNIADTWTIAPQNKWIDIAADAENDKITIGHKYSPETTNRNDTGDTSAQTPSFGTTFKVPNYETDKAGHITKSSAHTVMIPQNSYTETSDKTAGVITTMSLDKSEGAFEATRVNVGTLALTEYIYDASNTEKISSDDSINTAFSKIDAQIAKEIVDRATAITETTNNLNSTISDLNDAMTAMDVRLVASDNTLTESLNEEKVTRESEDIRVLKEANQYTDSAVSALVDSSPETLDTLKELATALGNDENFSTTVTENIGANTVAIEAEKEKIDTHIADKENPHEVTAIQVGLGNVTNESKATMFTNPEFTGVPIAPTADAGTSSTQVATTEFVVNEVANTKEDINQSLEAINEALAEETDAREAADQAQHEEFTDALAVETQARLDSLEALLNDLIVNYGITLNAPVFEITQEENETEGKVIMTVSASDECTMIWYKNQLDADPIAVSESVPVGAFEITEDGEYYCVITRTHNSHTSEAQSEVYSIVVPVTEPEDTTT